jgi:hypothetical protein
MFLILNSKSTWRELGVKRRELPELSYLLPEFKVPLGGFRGKITIRLEGVEILISKEQ